MQDFKRQNALQFSFLFNKAYVIVVKLSNNVQVKVK